jgi:putative ubiquitin-RnfH superfamily antitoxin RatB of RatAB toxin-antitoxin module
VPPGTSIRGVVERSGILNDISVVRAATLGFGIWGEIKALDTPISPGDRVEIYAPLAKDPKAIRRRRIARQAGRNKQHG